MSPFRCNIKRTTKLKDALAEVRSEALVRKLPEIRRVNADEAEIEQALRVLLKDQPGGADKISKFRKLAECHEYDLTRQILAIRNEKILFACMFACNPGRTAFVLMSPSCRAGLDDAQAGAFVEALKQLTEWAFAGGVNLLQMLVTPDDQGRYELGLRAGFEKLTDLVYMARTISAGCFNALIPVGCEWVSYDSEIHNVFRDVIASTYQDSLDCPELASRRDMEDVIAGHKSVGDFDSSCWNMLLVDGRPAGVVLCTPLAEGNAADLTYMGLVPEARGHGLGRLLVNRGLANAWRLGMECLTLAVDVRNENAYELYRSCGFQEVLRRTVLMYPHKPHL